MDIKELHKKINIDKDLLNTYINKISSFRGINLEFINYTESIVDNIMDSKDTNVYYYPCELLELRNIIKNKEINNPKLLFNIDLCNKYLGEYLIFIKLNILNINDIGQKIGNTVYIKDNILDISGKIASICINNKKIDQRIQDSVKGILANSSCDIAVEVLGNALTPSIGKQASITKANANAEVLKHYVVNIELLNIKDHKVAAKNPFSAVESVLYKKWQEKNDNRPRPLKYKAEYWLNTPFWNQIVSPVNLGKKAQVENNIKLNDNEANIFKYIINVRNSFPEANGVKLLVAGGWTRDKILGIDSDDIDIAISKLSGVEFANLLKKYSNLKNDGVIGKIYSTSLDKTSNLESAALEVAGVDIYGVKVEFVRFRTEVYKDNSRVPVAVGTDNPEEDAKRRDLTINSLYYNIDTNKIEDYTGGLNDINNKILRTPILSNISEEEAKTILNKQNISKEEYDQANQYANAVNIYKQDPLRILRTLRFYSRYNGYNIDNSVIKAMNNKDVHENYKKLSPERSSKEIKKMMEGSNVVPTTKLLFDTNLYKIVFGVPDSWHNISIDQQNKYHNLSLKDHVLKVMDNLYNICKKDNVPSYERSLLMLSALFHDFGKMHPDIRKPKIDKDGKPVMITSPSGESFEQMRYIGHENESAKFVDEMMKKMAFDPKEREFVRSVVQSHMEPHDFDDRIRPKDMGRFLSNNKALDYYKYIMMHAKADATGKGYSEEEVNNILNKRNEHLSILDQYVRNMGKWINTPLLDGNKINEIVNRVAPDLIKYKAKFKVSPKDTNPIFYLKYLIDKLLEKQREFMVVTPEFESYLSTLDEANKGELLSKAITKEKAVKIIESEAKQALSYYKKYQKDNQIDKKADASSYRPTDIHSPNNLTPFDYEINKVSPAKPPFKLGDVVRLRNTNYLTNPALGRVIHIDDSNLKVEWYEGVSKGKTLSYNLNNLRKINRLIEKI